MAHDQRFHTHFWEALVWWEMRRIPYNAAVGATGLISAPFWLFLTARPGSAFRDEGDWRLLLILIAGYGIIANIGYTLGLVLELRSVRGGSRQRLAFRHLYYRLDVRLSCAIVMLPMWYSIGEWIFHSIFDVYSY